MFSAKTYITFKALLAFCLDKLLLFVWRHYIEIRQFSVVPTKRTVSITLKSFWELSFERFAVLFYSIYSIFQGIRIQISEDETFTLLTYL
jgi:hypothetical protein